MTVDDENSIYVGGLPYSATEETLRRVFGLYGAVVAVKIINDRSTRGKCYGFVTFRNPRSVDDAIAEMDGKTIDGRVVRVNGVTTRGGRPEFSRQRFRNDMGRSMEWERGRGRKREYNGYRFRHQERYGDRSKDHEHSLDHDDSRERGYQQSGYDHDGDDYMDGEHFQDRSIADDERGDGGNLELNADRNGPADSDEGREMEGSDGIRRYSAKESDHRSTKQNGFDDQHQRELSSNSDDYYDDDIKEKLERAMQKHDELKKEISQMEGIYDDKQRLVSDLQNEAMKLEDELLSARRLSSHRKMQLSQLHKCFLQVKDYKERLKNSEQELQNLVNSAILDSDDNMMSARDAPYS